MITKVKGDMTSLIERLESFEDRCGIMLSALYARLENDLGLIRLTITGELQGSKVNRLPHDLILQVAVYDKAGRVMAAKSHFIDQESFFAFDVFEIFIVDLPTAEISKIGIYPKVG